MNDTYYAPAKINLSLRVHSTIRPDGYHEVDIVMARLDLADQLDFHNSRTTTLLCGTPGVPVDDNNLVLKAVREFEKVYGRKVKQRITLTKNIPFGAGLGGGSADAAVTLLALNERLGTNYELEELSAMAANIGSDVPFFLNPVVSHCGGRGEIVTPLPELAGWSCPVVLLKPQFGVSTPSAYRGLRGARRMKGVSYGPQMVDQVKIVNELERSVFTKFPFLGLFKMWMLEQPGVRAALMSGSGSTMFALTDTPEHAQALAAAAKEQIDPSLFTFCGTVNPQA